MAIEHILVESDTLQSLAEEYLQDSSRWREIVDYNRLDAPYIVDNSEELESKYGQGYLTISRTNYSTALKIPKDWTFKTKPYLIGGMVKTFVTTEDTHVPAGISSFYVHVRSIEPGTYGNVSQGLITEPGKEFVKNNIDLSFITNEKDFEGGTDTKVLTIGDSIFIPEGNIDTTTSEDIETQLEMLGGSDFHLMSSSELGHMKNEDVWGYERNIHHDAWGDLMGVSGVQNIMQAVNDRLMAEKGELQLHPEYGTNIGSILGTHRTSYTDKLIELEIYEALAYEDRITDVEVLDLSVEGTSVNVELKFRPSFSSKAIIKGLSLKF